MFTIKTQMENKEVIEKSKFIAYIFNCNSLEEQSQILKNLKREHLSATHICYASNFYCGNQVLSYSSDDREPSGTAGIQILQAIKENDLINVFCAVVRYFGGIKLGVAGLGRAYKETALTVIEKNKKQVELRSRCKVECDYNQYQLIKKWIDKNNFEVIDIEYQDNVSFFIYLTDNEQNEAQNMAYNLQVYPDEQKYC
ncbi:MAG: YigZ family protein [Clostridia bacterium]|nr:YigZ family protein [Clostridia bacterium]